MDAAETDRDMTNQEQADGIIRIFGLDSRPTMRFEITHGDDETIAALVGSRGLGVTLAWIPDGGELRRYLYVSSDGDENIAAADRDGAEAGAAIRAAIVQAEGDWFSFGAKSERI